MARKPAKKAASKKGAVEKVTAKDLMKLPSDPTIKSAATEVSQTRKKVTALTGDKGLAGFLQGVKREKGLHPKALKDVESLRDRCIKTDKGLAAVATYLAHREHYMEVLGVNEMVAKQGQMYTRPEAGESEKVETKVAAKTANDEPDVRPRNLRQPGAGTTTEGNVTTLINPKHVPSQAEIDRIADAAEAPRKPH